MAIGKLFHANEPKDDEFNTSFLYFAILFCQRKRIDLTNERFVNTNKFRCHLLVDKRDSIGRENHFSMPHICVMQW